MQVWSICIFELVQTDDFFGNIVYKLKHYDHTVCRNVSGSDVRRRSRDSALSVRRSIANVASVRRAKSSSAMNESANVISAYSHSARQSSRPLLLSRKPKTSVALLNFKVVMIYAWVDYVSVVNTWLFKNKNNNMVILCFGVPESDCEWRVARCGGAQSTQWTDAQRKSSGTSPP